MSSKPQIEALIARWRYDAGALREIRETLESATAATLASGQITALTACADDLSALLTAEGPATEEQDQDERHCKHGHDHATPEGARACDGVLGSVYTHVSSPPQRTSGDLSALFADHSEALKFVREMSIQACPHWCAKDCLACRAKAWLHEARK